MTRLVALLILTLGITAPALGAPDGPRPAASPGSVKPNARLEATADEPAAAPGDSLGIGSLRQTGA